MSVDRQYVEEFRLFTRLWKTVLAEKKELNAKVNAFKKAQKNLEQARKKYTAAETKQVRNTCSPLNAPFEQTLNQPCELQHKAQRFQRKKKERERERARVRACVRKTTHGSKLTPSTCTTHFPCFQR